MKKIKSVVFGVVMSTAVSACASDEITTVRGEVGGDVKLSLESNPTTGYGWMIKDLPDGLIFVSGGYEQSKDCPKDAVGCGGEEIFHFIGERKGEITLKLIYGQSFNKSSWKEKDVKVLIE